VLNAYSHVPSIHQRSAQRPGCLLCIWSRSSPLHRCSSSSGWRRVASARQGIKFYSNEYGKFSTACERSCLDAQTRCIHYSKPADVIAIKMKCCGAYYACEECHDAVAHHAIEVWPRGEWDRVAILCGVCGTELTVRQYLVCSNQCPGCDAMFNPGCRNHYHFYFEE